MRRIILSIFPLIFMQSAIAQAPADPATDPRGPVAGWADRTLVDKEGVQAVEYHFQPSPETTPWRPAWVWVAGAEGENNQPFAAHFRRELIVPDGAAIKTAYAKVTADRVYRLWVNGRLVSRGPDDPGNDVAGPVKWSHQWLYSRVDLAPYLHNGKNVIAAEVITSDLLPNFSLGKPGFAFEASIERAAGPAITVSTRDEWKAEASRAYSVGPFTDSSAESGLRYDARLDTPAWREPSFPDSSWQSARRIDADAVASMHSGRAPWGPVMVSQIPPAMEAIWPVQAIARATPNLTTAAPLARIGEQLRLQGDGMFSVDYDRVLSGYVSMKVRGPAGTIITIEPAETKTSPGPMRPFQVTLGEGETIFEYPGYDSFSTIRVTVSHATGPVEFADVRATFVSQPVSYRGSFESSDEALNRLWKASRWLTQICMQNRYLDSPHNQEPLGDTGDSMIESLENFYAFDEPALTRQDLRKFAGILDHFQEANFHTSYALLWLQMLMDYYDYTGDEALLREMAPTVNRLLDHFATFQGANGLLSEAPNYMFMDWVTIGGFPGHHPPAEIGQGYMTAFYYRALADGARLATILGDNPRRLKYEQLRTGVKAAFERELWDANAGLYRDGKPHTNHQPTGRWLPEDKDIVTHTPHVNALAVLYDLAPKARQPLILEKLLASPPLEVQPYFMHFILAAEDHAGVFDRYGWAQMQQWHLNPETRTFSEDWNAGDHSHGWGGTPLIQMSSLILGVTPASPGYKRVMISPRLAGLETAKGVVPTPLGDVQVSWTKTDTLFTLDISAPPTMAIDLVLPALNFVEKTLVIDSHPASAEMTEAGRKLTLAGGTHRIVAAGNRADVVLQGSGLQ